MVCRRARHPSSRSLKRRLKKSRTDSRQVSPKAGRSFGPPRCFVFVLARIAVVLYTAFEANHINFLQFMARLRWQSVGIPKSTSLKYRYKWTCTGAFGIGNGTPRAWVEL